MGRTLKQAPFPGFVPLEMEGDEGEEQGQPEEGEGWNPEPVEKEEKKVVELSDDTLVQDVDGQAKPWREIKEARLRHDDYTKKTQALAQDRGIIEAYKANPDFRSKVDEIAKREYVEKVLGYKVQDDKEPSQEQEEAAWHERFDEDPRAVLNEELTKTRRETLEEAQKTARIAAVWDILEAEIGEDFDQVKGMVREAAEWLRTNDPEQYSIINDNPGKTAMLVKRAHQELLKRRKETEKPTKTASPPGRTSPSFSNVTTDTGKKKSIWEMSESDFDALTKKVRGF